MGIWACTSVKVHLELPGFATKQLKV